MIHEPLKYWQNITLPNQSLWCSPDIDKYITFEVDCAGLNNIRLSLECIVTFAVLTGRTLVLPPPQPIFLLDYQNVEDIPQSTRTYLRDVFDIRALEAVIPIITTEEFLAREGVSLNIPKALQDNITENGLMLGQLSEIGYLTPWYEWLRSTALMPTWNPQLTMFCHPSIEKVVNSGFQRNSNLVDGRQLVENDSSCRENLVLHFPSNPKQGLRSFGMAINMVAFANQEFAQLHRRLLKYSIRYHPKVYEIASEIIDHLKLFSYTALHIRRKDFSSQFGSAVPENLDFVLKNLEQYQNQNEVLYIATDEDDSDYLMPLSKIGKTIKWTDLETISELEFLSLESVDSKLIGPIEQLICAGARLFIGTKYSTFSTYINRIRCFISAPELTPLFHTESPEEQNNPACRRGREWNVEYEDLWQQC